MSDARTSDRAARLRRDFDATFAAPPRPHREAGRRFLLVTVAGVPCAVPMDESASVHRSPVISPLPARLPAFRGVATMAGAVVPVYDLAARLGFTGATTGDWLIASAGRHRVALLVDGVEGYAEADASASDAAGTITLLTIHGTPRRLVSLAGIVDALEREIKDLQD
jgi:purine-binding chemotaxis protein CheW